MVLYDFLMIVKSSVPKNQLGDILRRTGTRVLDAGGVITDVTSYGTRTLAYEFKAPGEKHFEAHTVQMSFNCAPTVLENLKHDMRTDERVLRWIAVKDRALKPLKNFPARDPRPGAPQDVPELVLGDRALDDHEEIVEDHLHASPDRVASAFATTRASRPRGRRSHSQT